MNGELKDCLNQDLKIVMLFNSRIDFYKMNYDVNNLNSSGAAKR